MSDTNLPTTSYIELSDIRKLDILLTQCESSSYENICNDCCAKLGSLEDDDDDQKHSSQDSSGSVIIDMPKITPKIHSSSSDDAEEPNRNQYDVISKVLPTITSSHASIPSPTAAATLTAASTTLGFSRNGRTLQKSSDCDQLSFDADYKTFALTVEGYQQSASAENTYCAKCGGVTSAREKDNFGKKRYFSLDKERNENTTNLLQCLGRNDSPKGGSENVLHSGRKQCSFESNHKHNKSSLSAKPSAFACEKCDVRAPITMTLSKSTKKCGHRSENVGCCSRSHQRDKSNKSSQNSVKDTRSRKNSIFVLGSKDDGGGGSIRSKWTATQHSRKTSTRGPNLHEEFDAETREILLGGAHGSKFDQNMIKIPEPVEAVSIASVVFVVLFLCALKKNKKCRIRCNAGITGIFLFENWCKLTCKTV